MAPHCTFWLFRADFCIFLGVEFNSSTIIMTVYVIYASYITSRPNYELQRLSGDWHFQMTILCTVAIDFICILMRFRRRQPQASSAL